MAGAASTRSFGDRVDFTVSREVAFDYLVDPHRRPEWQSSLAAVSGVTGKPRTGQTWVDHTLPGLRPQMETTELDRPTRWSESGTWRFVRADLTLDFAEPDEARNADSSGCVVTYRFRIHALGPVGLVASLIAVPAVGADLKRAARLLAQAD